MNDIFISYKNEDRPWARKLAGVLQKLGYVVWWDREISPGQTWDEVIEEAIANTKCVIVMWSSQSVKSSWVKNEADEGLQRNILLPIMIEDVKIPLAYRRIQTANLIEWDWDLDHREFKNLLVSIERISGKAPKILESEIEPEKETAEPVEELVSAETGKEPKKVSSLFKTAKVGYKTGSSIASKPKNMMVYVALAIVVIFVCGTIYKFFLSNRWADNKLPSNHIEKAEDKSQELTEKFVPSGSDASVETEKINRAKEVYSELRQKELDPRIRDIDLLNDYKKLWDESQNKLGRDAEGELKRKIEDLELNLANYKSIISLDKSDPAMVYERTAAWKTVSEKSRNSPEKREADGKINELGNILYSTLHNKELDSGIRCVDLLSEYKKFLVVFQNALSQGDAGKLKRKIEDLERSVKDYISAVSLDKKETAVVFERMAAWKKFSKQCRNSPEKKEAEKKIGELKNIIANTATITTADNFVTCQDVDEDTMPSQKIAEKLRSGAKEAVEKIKNLKNIISITDRTSESDNFVVCQEVDKDTVQPQNITDKFSLGANVTVWALIHVPKKEDLQMIWYVDGREVQARIVAAIESPAFRTCDVASSNQHIGLDEVRLYNSQNILIGRKTFSTSD